MLNAAGRKDTMWNYLAALVLGFLIGQRLFVWGIRRIAGGTEDPAGYWATLAGRAGSKFEDLPPESAHSVNNAERSESEQRAWGQADSWSEATRFWSQRARKLEDGITLLLRSVGVGQLFPGIQGPSTDPSHSKTYAERTRQFGPVMIQDGFVVMSGTPVKPCEACQIPMIPYAPGQLMCQNAQCPAHRVNCELCRGRPA